MRPPIGQGLMANQRQSWEVLRVAGRGWQKKRPSRSRCSFWVVVVSSAAERTNRNPTFRGRHHNWTTEGGHGRIPELPSHKNDPNIITFDFTGRSGRRVRAARRGRTAPFLFGRAKERAALASEPGPRALGRPGPEESTASMPPNRDPIEGNPPPTLYPVVKRSSSITCCRYREQR